MLRRELLSQKPQVQRPPWSLVESDFVDQCSRCGDCIAACPERVLTPDSQGRPMTDFSSSSCTFCGDCDSACQTSAIDRHSASQAWPQKARIGLTCLLNEGVSCRSCVDHCEVQALRFQHQLGQAGVIVVSDDACTACGACLPICPTQSIQLRIPS